MSGASVADVTKPKKAAYVALSYQFTGTGNADRIIGWALTFRDVDGQDEPKTVAVYNTLDSDYGLNKEKRGLIHLPNVNDKWTQFWLNQKYSSKRYAEVWSTRVDLLERMIFTNHEQRLKAKTPDLFWGSNDLRNALQYAFNSLDALYSKLYVIIDANDQYYYTMAAFIGTASSYYYADDKKTTYLIETADGEKRPDIIVVDAYAKGKFNLDPTTQMNDTPSLYKTFIPDADVEWTYDPKVDSLKLFKLFLAIKSYNETSNKKRKAE